MASLRVRWRGPLAFLRWRDPDGRARRLVFWPDTLPAAARGELKLALQQREAAGGGASMAG
jgi:toxin CptA